MSLVRNRKFVSNVEFPGIPPPLATIVELPTTTSPRRSIGHGHANASSVLRQLQIIRDDVDNRGQIDGLSRAAAY